MSDEKKPMSKYYSLWMHFQNMFPSLTKAVTHWGCCKGNAIFMETTANVTLFFTYDDVDHWSLETKAVHEQNRE